MGYDVGLGFQLNDSDVFNETDQFSLRVPTSDVSAMTTLRLGYLLSDRSELETRFGLASFSGSHDDETSDLALGLDYAHHFDSGTRHPFIRVGGRWYSHSVGQFNVSQAGLDGGFGIKHEIGHQLATRMDAGIARFFGTDDRVGHWDLSLAFGISFFTR